MSEVVGGRPLGLGAGLSEAQLAQLVGSYKLTPATLMTKLDPSWIAAPWLQYLSFKVVEVVRRGNCGLCISAPPRHGKSTLITKAVPLWVLENFPTKSVVIATYGEELSTDFSRDIKDFIESSSDKLSIRLRQDVRRVAHFQNVEGGSIKAVGLKGTITGRGADVLIIDDYIKEPTEAMSPTYLKGLWEWFSTVARTRLEPGAVVIIVATRWVPGDLHGQIEKQQKLTGRTFYEHIKIPALYLPQKKLFVPDPSDPEKMIAHMVPDLDARDRFGRKYEDPLFPERYDKDRLMDIRAEVSPRWFNAMFQQDPQSEETMFANPDWLEEITWEHFAEVFNSSDRDDWTAARGWDFSSISDAGDFTAGPLLYYNKRTDESFFVDLIHGQFGPDRVELEFTKADVKDPKFIQYALEREPGSSGTYTTRHFTELLQRPRRIVKDYPTVTKKYLRAQPFLAACENLGGPRKVFYVKAPWNTVFREQMTEFGTDDKKIHDDIMDGLAIAYNHLTGKKPMAGSWGRGPNDPTDRSKGRGSRLEKPKKGPYSVVLGDKPEESVEKGQKRRGTGLTWGRRAPKQYT